VSILTPAGETGIRRLQATDWLWPASLSSDIHGENLLHSLLGIQLL